MKMSLLYVDVRQAYIRCPAGQLILVNC